MGRVRFRDWVSIIDELTAARYPRAGRAIFAAIGASPAAGLSARPLPAALPRHRDQAYRQLFEVAPSRRVRPVPIAESLSRNGRHQTKPAIRELSHLI